MNRFCFLPLLWICLGLFKNGYTVNDSSRPDVVSIGFLFNPYSTVGRVAKIAIEEAVKDVNSDPNILSNTKLVVKEQKSNCSGFLGMVEGLRSMETGIVALIGPQCSVVAHIICHFANELQVPLLSYSVTDPTLSRLQFPFFIRTTHNDAYQMAAVASVVDHYGWKKVIAIFVDDDYGRNGVAALNDKLVAKRCTISYKVGVHPEAVEGEIMDLLVKLAMLQSQIIVLHVNSKLGFKIFSVAKYLEMMGNGYVWIATDWLSTELDSYAPLSSERMDTVQGVIALRAHTPDSDRKRDFSARWHKRIGDSVGLNSYGLYTYDSVMLLARAMENFFDQGGKISFSNDTRLNSINKDSSLHLEEMTVFDQGNLLLKNILQTHINGLTGQIQITSDSSIVHPAYDILNVVGTGVRRIGFWSNYSGLSTVPPETLYSKPPNMSSEIQKLYGVIWPGETLLKPRGWVFPNNGKQLRIGVPIRVSYREFVSQVHGTNNFKGFCIDVFTAAVNLLPYAVPFQFVPYGDGKKNPSYTDMVNLITTGHFDGVAGDVAIITNRSRIVDYTQPFVASGLVVVAPFKKLNTGAWAFLRPFTPLMWAIIACFFLFIGIVVWFLEHRINDEFRGPPRQQCMTILWFSFSTMFFAQRENVLSTLGRVVVLLWLFVVLIINASYTASLTSILTVQHLSSHIKGIQSLKDSKDPIGYQVGSFAERYLREELGVSESRLVALGSPEDYAKALEDGPGKGGVAAIVDERPYVESFLSSNCAFRIVGQEFTKSGWGFAFPRDSPLPIDLSSAILELAENGELQRLHDKWLKQNFCTLENAELDSDRLQLKSFWGLFLVCGIACFVSLFIYFVQILRKLCTSTRNDSIADGQSNRSFQRFLSIMDEKEGPSKRGSKKRKIDKPGLESNSSKRMEFTREESICSISQLE